MFNPLTPASLCLNLAEVLRSAASVGRGEEPADEFFEAQLLAAASIARLTAVELEQAPVMQRWWREALTILLARDEHVGAGEGPARRELMEAVSAGDQPALEESVAAWMRSLAASSEPAARGLLVELRGTVREAVDREVAGFAGGPGTAGPVVDES